MYKTYKLNVFSYDLPSMKKINAPIGTFNHDALYDYTLDKDVLTVP